MSSHCLKSPLTPCAPIHSSARLQSQHKHLNEELWPCSSGLSVPSAFSSTTLFPSAGTHLLSPSLLYTLPQSLLSANMCWYSAYIYAYSFFRSNEGHVRHVPVLIGHTGFDVYILYKEISCIEMYKDVKKPWKHCFVFTA